MRKTVGNLWKVQLSQHPNSVRMTPRAIYEWADSAYTPQSKLSRYVQIAMSIQYPVHLFYRIEGTRYMGIRFGLKPHEYMSLYSD